MTTNQHKPETPQKTLPRTTTRTTETNDVVHPGAPRNPEHRVAHAAGKAGVSEGMLEFKVGGTFAVAREEGGVNERLIITIDGPAGTGKSTVARALAQRLGLEFLDTGAMYRAAAAIAIDNGVDVNEHERFVRCVESHDLHFDFETDPPTLLCSGRSIMHRLRDPDVTRAVSKIASISELRREMVQKQRQIGLAHPRLVTEGRDQGSVVFPDADVKFYLSATPRVRAHRRAEQLRAGGTQADAEALEREIIDRDRSDSTRTDGPLTCPADAVSVDTSQLSFEQVVDLLESEVRRRLHEQSLTRSPVMRPMVRHERP